MGISDELERITVLQFRHEVGAARHEVGDRVGETGAETDGPAYVSRHQVGEKGLPVRISVGKGDRYRVRARRRSAHARDVVVAGLVQGSVRFAGQVRVRRFPRLCLPVICKIGIRYRHAIGPHGPRVYLVNDYLRV